MSYRRAEVVVALIGPKWKGDSGRDGRSRLENGFDYVRREIVCALDRGTPLVPILLPGGSLPDHSTLARFDLDGFEEYQAFPLSPRHWDADVTQLTDDIRHYFRAEATS